MSLESKLRTIASATDDLSVWRPALLDLTRAEDRRHLEDLLETRQVLRVRDTLEDQLQELLLTRAVPARPAGEELDALARGHLGGRSIGEYGTWVHYPWSGSLVHVLPRDEYRELRSSRNGYKITPEEQRRLRGFTIGVVGLSVGQSSAVTLALEGVGGRFRLADFDTLSLSNMNRLRTSVQNIGAHKCVIAAREMLEIDPYLEIELFPKGLTEDSIEPFLRGSGGENLDLLIEECDDFFIKVFVRERARALRIPVIMETSNRGMLDVERFDLEPDRPLFHGLLAGMSASDVKALSPREKVPMALRIIGQGGLSGRVAASMLEIQETLSSWPQLASSVALGGALTTDVARRILLEHFKGSGRFFTDLDVTVNDHAAADLAEATALDLTLRREPRRPAALPILLRAGRSIRARDVRRVVAHGVLAPSRGNAQPWRFVARTPLLHRPARVRCYADREPTFLDFERTLTHVAVGAAVENMLLASRAMGLRAAVRTFPDADDPSFIAELLLTPDSAAEAPLLAAHITRRVTSRKPDRRDPIAPSSRRALGDAAAMAGARLHWLTAPAALDELGAVQGAADRLGWLTRPIHDEITSELRWTQDEVESSRDGLDVTALDLPPGEIMKLWLLRSWPAAATIASVGGGRGLARPASALFGATPAAALLTVGGVGRESYLRGGRALQRVWLTASSLGLSIQPLSDLVSLFARITRGGGAGLGERAQETLADLRRRYLSLFDVRAGDAEIMILRVHRAGPPAARSLRKPLGSVLVFEDARGRRIHPSRIG